MFYRGKKEKKVGRASRTAVGNLREKFLLCTRASIRLFVILSGLGNEEAQLVRSIVVSSSASAAEQSKSSSSDAFRLKLTSRPPLASFRAFLAFLAFLATPRVPQMIPLSYKKFTRQTPRYRGPSSRVRPDTRLQFLCHPTANRSKCSSCSRSLLPSFLLDTPADPQGIGLP